MRIHTQQQRRRGHEFEKEQVEGYRKGWRKEKKRK